MTAIPWERYFELIAIRDSKVMEMTETEKRQYGEILVAIVVLAGVKPVPRRGCRGLV